MTEGIMLFQNWLNSIKKLFHTLKGSIEKYSFKYDFFPASKNFFHDCSGSFLAVLLCVIIAPNHLQNIFKFSFKYFALFLKNCTHALSFYNRPCCCQIAEHRVLWKCNDVNLEHVFPVWLTWRNLHISFISDKNFFVTAVALSVRNKNLCVSGCR